MSLAYNTQETLQLLGISLPTLIKYRKMLGIIPRRKSKSRKRFYLWEDIQDLMRFIHPPETLFSKRLDERLELYLSHNKFKRKK